MSFITYKSKYFELFYLSTGFMIKDNYACFRAERLMFRAQF